MTDPYRQPLDRLMKLGAEPARRRVWPDYRHLGLTDRHVPGLIQIATDPELHAAGEKDRAAWAPIHAWRALAQLDATTAAVPLVALLERGHENGWIFEELPIVLGMIGPAALPGITLLLFEEGHSDTLRIAAARALVEVAHDHPERRGEVVAVLARQLEDFAHQSAELNAILVADLAELRATEAAPAMEAAFAAGAVDLSVSGDWEDVQVDLGLLEERTTPPTPWSPLAPDLDDAPVSGRVPDPGTRASAKARSRRKAEKQSRKRNRRK